MTTEDDMEDLEPTVGEKIEAMNEDDDYELVDEDMKVPAKSRRKLMPIELL